MLLQTVPPLRLPLPRAPPGPQEEALQVPCASKMPLLQLHAPCPAGENVQHWTPQTCAPRGS